MSNEDSSQKKFKKPKFRSPPYPYVSLGKAIERAGELYQQAQQHLIPKHVLASSWGYGLKSSGLLQTSAALKQYGLLRDQGSKDQRRFQLTDDAVRILADPDIKSLKRINAIKNAALAPSVYSDLWDTYGVAGLSGSMDNTIISYLTFDMKDKGEHPYSSKAAAEVLDGYKSSVSYAGLTLSDTLDQSIETKETTNHNLNPSSEVSIGDMVQREVDGVFTFQVPQRVRQVQEFNGNKWVFVENSESGISINEIVVRQAMSKNTPTSALPPKLPIPPTKEELERTEHSSWTESTHIEEGKVTLVMPETLSEESYTDIKDWLDLIMRKAKRRAGV